MQNKPKKKKTGPKLTGLPKGFDYETYFTAEEKAQHRKNSQQANRIFSGKQQGGRHEEKE
jgi:hypothetical protein